MKNKPLKPKFKEGWCFATINNRLAEVFFSKKEGIYGYAYVKKEEYPKKWQRVIEKDTQKYQFSYRNKMFKDKLTLETFPIGEINTE